MEYTCFVPVEVHVFLAVIKVNHSLHCTHPSTVYSPLDLSRIFLLHYIEAKENKQIRMFLFLFMDCVNHVVNCFIKCTWVKALMHFRFIVIPQSVQWLMNNPLNSCYQFFRRAEVSGVQCRVTWFTFVNIIVTEIEHA